MTSPTPWTVGRGYEQMTPGIFIYASNGTIVCASYPSKPNCVCEPLSEEDAILIVMSVNANATQ